MHGANRKYRYVWDVSIAPRLKIGPEAWLPPDVEENHVQIFTPVDASVCPTVGANCRRYVTADAMGMAKERGRHEEEDVDGAGIGLSTNTVKDTTVYPGSGLSGEITPLLLLVSSISVELDYNNCFSIFSGESESRHGQGSLLLP